jgi:hypothetical protein
VPLWSEGVGARGALVMLGRKSSLIARLRGSCGRRGMLRGFRPSSRLPL